MCAALVKSGYLLERLSIPRYCKNSDNVLGADNQQERLSTRVERILRDYTPDSAEMRRRDSPNCMATCRPRQKCSRRSEIRRSNKTSEIPCRVSSDPHEGSNDLSTVSTEGSAKLKYP